MKKKITLVTSAYRSDPYLLGYLENMVQLVNRDQIAVILLMNDPTPYEIELTQVFQNQWDDLFQVQYTERETIGTSLNRGLRAAETPYIAYADVDDRRPLDSYQRLLATLENDPDAQFTYGDFIVVKKAEHTHGRYIQAPEFDPIEFTRSSCVGPGHFFRKSLLDRAGYFDEQLRSGADFDFQIRAAFNGRFKKTSGIVAYYLQDDRLPSASKTPWQKIETCVISLRYGIYDKLNYDYVSFTTPYTVSQILYGETWIPIKTLIPRYNEIIAERHSKWSQKGIKNYLKQKRFLGKISGLTKRIAGKIARDGLKETIQRAARYIKAKS